MVLIDTNIIVRILLNDNPLLFKRAKELIEKEEKLLVLDPIVFEVFYVLENNIYNTPKNEAILSVRRFLKQKKIVLENKELIELTLDKYNETNISVPDAYLLARNILNKDKVLTFDHKLNKLLI
jgi:predicted nucleic acid-binding protein